MSDYTVVETMIACGGSFAQTLAACWAVADVENRRRLETAFADVFEHYRTLARLRSAAGVGVGDKAHNREP